MKKTIIIIISILFAFTNGHAQFVVRSDGSGKIGSGTFGHNYFNNGYIGFNSSIYMTGGKNIAGLQGCAYLNSPSDSDIAIGVFGVAGNAENGHNMGVAGYLGGMKDGTAVFGSAWSNFGIPITGMYAAYFYGNTYITHTLTVPTIVTPSDLRLKENVTLVCESERGNRYLDRILDMNVIEYNYKMPYFTTDMESSSKESTLGKTFEHKHIGVAAQELQELFPDLVEEGQDGFLGVNYVELVPVLIRSIQELKEEVDELSGKSLKNASMAKSSSATEIETATVSRQNVLFQNTPNPFSEQTEIRFTLPTDAKNAYIYIFDMQGTLQKQIAITPSMQSVIINGYELSPGMYLYSLIVNGKEIDTKRMVISK